MAVAQTESEQKQSNWELSKENFQPLSSGRKMSCLTRNLQMPSVILTESEVDENICKFNEEIENYEGDDELEPWLKFIAYFEQNGISCGKFNKKYSALLQKCVKNFLTKDRHQNDKRFVDIAVKHVNVNTSQPERRISALRLLLNCGVGAKVSQMYSAIADELEKLQQFSAASEIIQSGIAANAQPSEYLNDALTNLQFRVAEHVKKTIDENRDASIQRSFGGSIHCGPTNEAPSIRVALSPANPSRSRPTADVKKIPLFKGENMENEEIQPNCFTGVNPAAEIERCKNEKENEMNPTKWNQPHSELASDRIESTSRNIEKITLYAEPEECTLPKPATSRPKLVQRPALCEIKLEETAESTIPRLPEAVKGPLVPSKLQINPPVSSISDSNVRIMYRKDQLWRNGREISFEQLRAEEYLKKSESGMGMRKNITRLTDNSGVSGQQCVPVVNEEHLRMECRIKELEEEIQSRTRQYEEAVKEKEIMLGEYNKLKSSFADEIEQTVRDAQTQCIQSFNSQIMQLTREKTEALIGFRMEKVQRLQLEDANSKLIEELGRATDEIKRLSLQLNANQLPLGIPNLGSAATAKPEVKFEVYADSSLFPVDMITHVLPPPSVPFDENNKENVCQIKKEEEKSKRPFAGVLMPSTSAEPQALEYVYNYMEDGEADETEQILRRNENAVDFNVSNLTKALHFNPLPLGNSTPDRQMGSDLPTEHYSRRLPGIIPIPFSYGSSSQSQDLPVPPPVQNSAIYEQRQNFNQTLQTVQNLSTIQESSKENRSSCTTSSSSSNRTTASTFNFNFTRSASRHHISHQPQ